jgi:hypothetical protein
MMDLLLFGGRGGGRLNERLDFDALRVDCQREALTLEAETLQLY